MLNMYPTPESLWQASWQELTRANNDRKHSFRTATLSTVSPGGAPNARTLVMRKADASAFTLRLYTDIRSDKVNDWLANPTVHWLFWNPKKQLQLSASGKISRWDKAQEAELFHQLPKHGRKSYATLPAPGESLINTADGLPENWENLELTQTDYALDNFAVFETHLYNADILYLDRESGHRRVRAHRIDAEWTINWITP